MLESGSLMDEYTGQLIGGPQDGNVVTSSVAEIPCRESTGLELDGPNKETTVLIVIGKYVWQPQGYFLWELESTAHAVLNRDD